MGRSLGLALLVALALAVVPAAATAKSLYATPSPALGATCAAESPCGLATALGTADSGDTVVIGAGTYASAAYGDGGKSLTIAGAVIGTGRPVVNGGFELTGAGTRISDVQIAGLFLGGGAKADRVLSINTGFGDGCEIETSGGSISNSLCVTPSTFFSGLSTQSRGGSGAMTAQNVTMIGHNGFYSGPSGVITIWDSIAMRNAVDGVDASPGSGTTNAIRTYILHLYGDQSLLSSEDLLTQEPVFRNPGDYREAANSPSINFGSETAEPGELDLNGNLRKIGPKTDIGAYEFVPDPPSVGTPSAAATSATSATVEATINPNSGRTYYHLEYGPTAAHGSSTPPVALPAATTPAAVQFDLTGLPANSTVHYWVVASSDGGATTTTDAVFDTPPPPASPAPEAAKKLAPILRFTQGTGGKPKGQPLLDRAAIKLSTGCGPVACDVTVTGKVKIGARSFGTLPGPKTPSHWQAGKQGAIKLRINSKLQKRVREYLEANAGARAKVFVAATYVAANGSKATRKLTIAVRPLS